MKMSVLLPFFCHFWAAYFHTLKIESDFFSRQEHLTLYRTGVYYRILLKEKQPRSCIFNLVQGGHVQVHSIGDLDELKLK